MPRKPPMSPETHRKAGLLLQQIFENLDTLHDLMPDRPLQKRCRSAHRYIQNHLRNPLRFSVLEAQRNPDGSFAFSLDDSREIYGIKIRDIQLD